MPLEVVVGASVWAAALLSAAFTVSLVTGLALCACCKCCVRKVKV